MIVKLTYWSICLFKGAVLSSMLCKFSLALTQVFDDFLFEVIFRVDISIADQFVSSGGTVLLSNFIFLFLLIEEIRISRHFRPLSFKAIRIQCNKDDVIIL